MKIILAFLSVLAISYTAHAAQINVVGVKCLTAEKPNEKTFRNIKSVEADTDQEDHYLDAGPNQNVEFFYQRMSGSHAFITALVRNNGDKTVKIKKEVRITDACDDMAKNDQTPSLTPVLDHVFTAEGKDYEYYCYARCEE